MRKLWMVLAAAGLVVAFAAPAGAAKLPVKPKTKPTTEQLTAALLTIEDMPTGYAADPPSDSTTGPCNGPTVKTLTDDGAIAPGVSAGFSKNQTVGPVVGEMLVAYPSTAAAKHAFGVVRNTYVKCPAFDSISSSGSAYHIENAVESFPKTGDQSIAIRRVVHPQDSLDSIAAEGDLVYIRRGNVLAGMSQGGLSLDSDLTAQMVGKAMKKLGRLGS